MLSLYLEIIRKFQLVLITSSRSIYELTAAIGTVPATVYKNRLHLRHLAGYE